MIRNRLAAGGLVVGLLGGGVAGAIFGVPGIVGAQDGSTTTSSTTTAAPTTEAPTTTVADNGSTTAPTPAPNNTDQGGTGTGNGKQSRDQHLKDALAPLVQNGTITQSQADAVIKAIEAAEPKGGPGAGRGHGGFPGFRGIGLGFDTAAKTIGISTQDLMKALASGQSVADVAKAHNVDPQKVIDALVADAKSKLDKAVAAGKLTQDEANQRLLKEAKVIGDLVNGTLPKMPFGFGHHGAGGTGASGGAPDSSTQHD
jgi:hypothetical protein